MSTYSIIFTIVIAVILVAVKFILEHQRDEDRRNGCEQDAKSYTMSGMLKLIRQDRKIKKAKKKEAKRLERDARQNPGSVKKPSLSIQQFSSRDDSEK